MDDARNHSAIAAWFRRVHVNELSASERWLLLNVPAGMAADKHSGNIDFRQNCILPGAFNPLHDAHRKMAQLAHAKSGKPVFFELDVNNADKSSLDIGQIHARVAQNFHPSGLILSCCPTFTEKSAIFPGTTFVVGADTMQRIGDLKYYRHCQREMESAMAQIVANECRFLVFGRKSGNKFIQAQKTIMVTELAEICDFVDRREFDMEISSTEIRRSTQ